MGHLPGEPHPALGLTIGFEGMFSAPHPGGDPGSWLQASPLLSNINNHLRKARGMEGILCLLFVLVK